MALAAGAAMSTFALGADLPIPAEMQGVGVDEKIGAQVDLDLTFIGENGYPVALRSFFHKDRPVVLNLVYYECPMLCNLVLNGQTATFREMPWTPGDQFEVVTISINPAEGFNLAQKKKAVYLASYDRPAPGWHFLADHDGHTQKLADQVGFHYKYDEKQKQFAHTAAVMILTPEGKMARYLYGIKFKSRDLRLGLTEAAAGRGSFSMDKILLFCFHYDPQARSYTLFATNFMRAGGALSALLLGVALTRLWRKERIEGTA